MLAMLSGLSDFELIVALGVLALVIVGAVAKVPPVARWRYQRSAAARERLVDHLRLTPYAGGRMFRARLALTHELPGKVASDLFGDPRRVRVVAQCGWAVALWVVFVAVAVIAKRVVL